MANLPPNMPVPVKQPSGKKPQIINCINLDCNLKVFNNNTFNIQIEYSINDNPYIILKQCPPGIIKLNNQKVILKITNMENQTYTGSFDLLFLNESNPVNNAVDLNFI